MTCPYCAEPIAAGAARCPWCGSDLSQVRRTDDVPATPATEPPAPSPAGRPFAWEDRSRNIFARWGVTWRDSHFKMEDFFRRVPVQGGHGSPLWYYVFTHLLMAVPAIFCLGLGFTFLATMGPMGKTGEGDEAMMFMFGAMAAYAVLYIPMIIVWLYIYAGLHHLCAKMLGSKAPFERTFRVICFAGGASVWSLVPYLGVLVVLAVAAVMNTFGYRQLHGFTTGRAVAAALIPPGLMILLCCGGYGAFIFLLIAAN